MLLNIIMMRICQMDALCSEFMTIIHFINRTEKITPLSLSSLYHGIVVLVIRQTVEYPKDAFEWFT